MMQCTGAAKNAEKSGLFRYRAVYEVCETMWVGDTAGPKVVEILLLMGECKYSQGSKLSRPEIAAGEAGKERTIMELRRFGQWRGSGSEP